MTDALIRLDDPDRFVRARAAEDLVARGGSGVRAAMLARLADETDPVRWPGVLTVLEGLGESVFDDLVAVIAGSGPSEVRRNAGMAFSSLRVPPARFATALGHPSAKVRDAALHALAMLGEAAAGQVSEVVPLLSDPEKAVREQAVQTCRAMGAGAVPVLRRVRRSAAPQRRAALEALAWLGALEGVDQRHVERLIRIKAPAETPKPMHLCGSWYAVPTDDQQAVLDAFGLSGPFPVTMRMGADARVTDLHYWSTPGHPHAKCARAYVTPALDGWTLVFGTFLAPGHQPVPDAEPDGDDETRCAALSRRFGRAACFSVNCGDSYSAWTLAEGGVVVRSYDCDEPESTIGPPHPAEKGCRLPHEEGLPSEAWDGFTPGPDSARWYEERLAEYGVLPECTAIDVAARFSVDPSALGPDTRVSGQGVLALTECGRRHGWPPAALEI
ncbi:HEAT repeat domain-containing protein [Actinoplanes sp. NPDC023801]|uniref:HEAT repeat domain-containing protein n=1 Tax=Actinoplanes sp. NPDC023801 TaxID=3154595 RepID=UPI0033F741A2